MSEEDMMRHTAKFPVHNKWQRTYVDFTSSYGYGPDELGACSRSWYCKQDRLEHIEEECLRFWRHNRAFLRKEYNAIKNWDTKKIQAYLCRLMKKRHYLLGFTLSAILIRKNLYDEYIPDAIAITMLNTMRHY